MSLPGFAGRGLPRSWPRMLPAMLQRLYRHNAWANARVFDVCRGLPRALLDEEAKGTSGTIGRTLKHLMAVEEVCLPILQGRGPHALGSRDEYLARDLAWFAARSGEFGVAYLAWLAGCDEAALGPEPSELAILGSRSQNPSDPSACPRWSPQL